MIQYFAKNLKVDGTKITLDIDGKGELTADMSAWDDLMTSIGGEDNILKVKLLGDMLEFTNDTHVEIDDFINLAEMQRKQNKLPASASLIKVLKKLIIN